MGDIVPQHTGLVVGLARDHEMVGWPALLDWRHDMVCWRHRNGRGSWCWMKIDHSEQQASWTATWLHVPFRLDIDTPAQDGWARSSVLSWTSGVRRAVKQWRVQDRNGLPHMFESEPGRDGGEQSKQRNAASMATP